MAPKEYTTKEQILALADPEYVYLGLFRLQSET